MDAFEQCLSAKGLITRGAFHPEPDDGVPGNPGTLVLIGNAGPAMWQAFAVAPERDDGLSDPMDRWITRVLTEIARGTGATALFPFGGPPYLPFQRWAQKADAVHPSPLGILIHPDYGLWHAYRGALAFEARLELPPPDLRTSPCGTCAEKPCLSACPVDAFSATGYDVPACSAHVRRPAGRDCVALGCRARRACPAGTDFVYDPAQAEFHMRAFRGANG